MELTAEQLASEMTAAEEQPVGATDSSETQPADQPEPEAVEQPEDTSDSGDQAEQPEETESAEQFWELDDGNGGKVKVTAEDALAAWKQKEAANRDYTQKTQNLAREKEAAQQRIATEMQFAEAFQDDIAQAKQLDAIVKSYEQLDWNQLRNSPDQVAYNARLSEYNNYRYQRDQAKVTLDQKRGAFSEYLQTQLNEMRAEVWNHMKSVDQSFNSTSLAEMFKAAEKYGYTVDELNRNVADKRLVHMWHDLYSKAKKYDDLQKKVPNAQNKLKQIPGKVNKPSGPTPTLVEQSVKKLNQGRSFSPREFAEIETQLSKGIR